MEREKQIDEMVEHIYEYVSKQDSAIVINYEFGGKHKQGIATELYNAGYRKERQGECEYCKTGEEKCETCTEFYKNIDDRCSGYNDGKCIKYTPVKYCFNCGAKMKGAE